MKHEYIRTTEEAMKQLQAGPVPWALLDGPVKAALSREGQVETIKMSSPFEYGAPVVTAYRLKPSGVVPATEAETSPLSID